jgi:hypothetical protein
MSTLPINFVFLYLFLYLFFVFTFLVKYFQTRTVQVQHVSDLASEREIHEFFSFSGEIEHIEIQRYFFYIIYL